MPNPFGGLGGTISSNISVGTVDPTDFEAKFIPDEEQNVYLDYRIQSKYEKDQHICMMPTAFWNPVQVSYRSRQGPSISYAGTPSVSFVQLAAPTLLWIVDWTCSRVNKQPQIPNPIFENNYGWVLLAENYEPGMLRVAADGISPIYRLSGTYVYGNINPSLLTIDDIVFTRPPWLEDFVSRFIPREVLQRNLITPNFGG